MKSKEALIQCLKEEKSQMASPDENVSSGELRGLSATLREEKERDAEVRRQGTAGGGAYQTVPWEVGRSSVCMVCTVTSTSES